MAHDSRSKGNRIGNTFVYCYLSAPKGAAGYYRVDVHPDSAKVFGAKSFDTWEDLEHYTGENETPRLFIIVNDNTESNSFGL